MSEKDEKIREAGDYLEYRRAPGRAPGEAILTPFTDSIKAADNLEEANKLQGRLCQDSEQRYGLMTSMELDALLQDQYQDRECREFLVDGAILTCTQSTREDQWVGSKESLALKCVSAAKGTDMAAEGIKMDEKGSGHLLDPDRVYGKLATKENGMWTDGKRHATVTDSSQADNIPCFGNCDRLPDSRAEKDFIQEMYWEGKAEGRIPKEKWGTCYCLRNLEEEWENYYIWGRTYATFPNEEGELESGITMTSMLFCKHGGFIYPVTSGQGVVCRVPEEVDGVIAEEDVSARYEGYGEWFYYIDKEGKEVCELWTISNEEFSDSKALTLEEVTKICNKHNPVLVEKGFDRGIYNLCQAEGLNPKVMLATLGQEQGWCKKGGYDAAFGVGAGGSPEHFENATEGIAVACRTYINWFNKGLEEGETLMLEKVNYDPGPDYSETRVGLPKGVDFTIWQNEHADYVRYMEDGQSIQCVNAAMYARLRYTPWVDFPPNGSKPLTTWLEIYNQLEDDLLDE